MGPHFSDELCLVLRETEVSSSLCTRQAEQHGSQTERRHRLQ